MVDEAGIAERYRLLNEMGMLDERGRRVWAAVEARAAGRGGIAAVVRATGVGESTLRRGLEELERRERLEQGRVRRLELIEAGRKIDEFVLMLRSEPVTRRGSGLGHSRSNWRINRIPFRCAEMYKPALAHSDRRGPIAALPVCRSCL